MKGGSGLVIFEGFETLDGEVYSIGVSGERIALVNCNSADYPGAEVVDLEGRFLSPGFIDVHTHFLHCALEREYADLSAASGAVEAAEILASSGSRIGRDYDDSMWSERLSSAAFDLVQPSAPLFAISRDRHSAVASSEALRMIAPPAKLRVGKDGVFTGAAYLWLLTRLSSSRSDSEREEAFRRIEAAAFEAGVTTVHALEGGAGWGMEDAEFMLSKERSETGIGVVLYPQTTDLSWALERGMKRIGGCILLDGTIGGRTAALRSDYSDRPGERGRLYFSRRALLSFVDRAVRRGMQTAFHAIGDAAVDMIASVYDEVSKRHGLTDARLRIEHCELLSEGAAEKIAGNGVFVSVQPAFPYLWEDGLYRRRLGNRRTNAYRTMKNAGIVLGGGSDFGVTDICPLFGINAAMNRPCIGERLGAAESIGLFTGDAARFSFGEGEIGCLSVGASADFAVLSGNPAREPVEGIRVAMTIKRGVAVYEA